MLGVKIITGTLGVCVVLKIPFSNTFRVWQVYTTTTGRGACKSDAPSLCANWTHFLRSQDFQIHLWKSVKTQKIPRIWIRQNISFKFFPQKMKYKMRNFFRQINGCQLKSRDGVCFYLNEVERIHLERLIWKTDYSLVMRDMCWIFRLGRVRVCKRASKCRVVHLVCPFPRL